MTSPAQRHRERLAAEREGRAYDPPAFEPQAATLIFDDPLAADLRSPASDTFASPALRHRIKVGAAAAAAIAAAGGLDVANDDGGLNPNATPYELQLLQLTDHKRQLKDIKSVERKIEVKRLIVPQYAAWCDAVVEACAAANAASPDDVVGTMLVWRIDIGDYPGALRLAEHMLRFNLPLPGRYDRDVATLLVDEFADAALTALRAAAPFPAEVLDDIEILTGEADIHDQARAKLFKARGLFALQLADNPPEGHAVAGGRLAALTEAQARLSRALELNPQIGVVKDLERVARELKKESATPPDGQA
ncbi:MAG: hypothetical protein KBC34_00845 [Phenylobacterium sp.]|nr:hypothetical protein [Phenylobacterium sp.]